MNCRNVFNFQLSNSISYLCTLFTLDMKYCSQVTCFTMATMEDSKVMRMSFHFLLSAVFVCIKNIFFWSVSPVKELELYLSTVAWVVIVVNSRRNSRFEIIVFFARLKIKWRFETWRVATVLTSVDNLRNYEWGRKMVMGHGHFSCFNHISSEYNYSYASICLWGCLIVTRCFWAKLKYVKWASKGL